MTRTMRRCAVLIGIAGFTVVLAAQLACARDVPDRSIVLKKIQACALVVDVRTPAEFAAWHVAGAINIPLDQIEKRIGEFGDRNRPIVVYCRTANRSGVAKKILQRHGFTDVTNGGGLRDMPPIERTRC